MTTTAWRWAHRNLFGTPIDAVLTLATMLFGAWLVFALASWAFNTSRWDIIPASLQVLLVGLYPAGQLWRAWSALAIFGLIIGATLIGDQHGRLVLSAWSLGLAAILALLAPPGIGLWGGLLLSLLVTAVASTLSLPFGILLALGRRSRLASIQIICTAYIEVMRSVPLILVVYCVWMMLPVLAPHYAIADALRGIAGFTLFFSAYVAEYVRSGLQAVPKDQPEAARSLGMSEFDVNRDIVLPQALRVALPALVGNILDIFNAAPLVFIIGLTDLLRAGQMILANPQYGDRTYEIYSFLFVTYFLIGSLMTFAARKLERQLGKGNR